MSSREAMAGAVLTTLARPGAWPVALLAFLVRGGVVVLLVPVVAIPTTSGLANVVAPALVPLVFGQPSPGLVSLAAALVGAVVAWIVVAGLVGARCDLALLAAAAEEEELVLPARRGIVVRGFAARLAAHLPLAVAVLATAPAVVDATYRQLVLPDDLSVPILLRVALDVPTALAVVAATWLATDAWSGLAQRRLTLRNERLVPALAGSLLDLVRTPAALVTAIVAPAVVLAGLLPAAVACGAAWDRLAVLLAGPASGLELAVTLVAFVGLWGGTLLLAGVLATWRSFTWTAEAIGRRPAPGPAGTTPSARAGGTIGDAAGGHPREWPSAADSGTLRASRGETRG